MATEFLRRHGMHPDQVDLPATCQRFLDEMAAGLAGQPSTILMLPTYLSCDHPLTQGIPVAVIDAGGTNARVAKVTFTEHGAETEYLDKFPMPGSLSPISKEDFFQTFASRLLPFIRDCTAVGFCFSFPCRIDPDRDGRVLYFDKEVRVADSEGMALIAPLAAKLEELGAPPVGGVVLNDTVAALLGGIAQTDREAWDGFVGLIYGTGLNVCYSEATQNIATVQGSHGVSMLVNTESGGCCALPSGDFDRELDAASEAPGTHLYEKMVSGAYLGPVIGLTLAGAAREGLLPEEFLSLGRLATYEANDFLVDPKGDNRLAALCRTDAQRDFVYQVADLLNLRAARLVAANLAAILLRADLGRSPEKPACIVAEGTTLYKSKLLFPYLEAAMEDYVGRQLGRHYGFLKPENANLVGSAAAALLNR